MSSSRSIQCEKSEQPLNRKGARLPKRVLLMQVFVLLSVVSLTLTLFIPVKATA